MALCYQPNIVIQGLKLAYDAANPKCYAGVGTFVNDLSGNNNTGYLYSGASYSSNLTGYFSFDGSDDYIGTNYIIDYDYLTVNVWFWSGAFSSFPNYTCILANQQSGSPYQTFDLRKKAGSIRTLQLAFATDSSGAEYALDIYDLNDYTWYNVQFAYDGSIFKIWLNGILVVNYSLSSTLRASNIPLMIARNPSFVRYAAINVSQVFVYNRALTEAEVQRNYNATKQRYIYPEDIITDNLLLNFDPGSNLTITGSGTSFQNLSGTSNNSILLNGATITGLGNTRSLLFDGVDDYLQISSSYTETFTAGTTVDVWVKFNSSASYARLLDISSGGGSNTVFLALARYSTTNDVVLASRASTTQGTTSGIRSTSTPISNGTIQNFTFVIGPGNTDTVPDSGSLIYCNGVLQTTVLDGSQYPYVPYVVNKTVWIGRSNFAQDTYLNANIYNIRIYNRALSLAEIRQNFNALRGRYGV